MSIVWILVALVLAVTLYLILNSNVSRSERKAQALREWADVNAEVEAERIRKETEALRKQLEPKEKENNE